MAGGWGSHHITWKSTVRPKQNTGVCGHFRKSKVTLEKRAKRSSLPTVVVEAYTTSRWGVY